MTPKMTAEIDQLIIDCNKQADGFLLNGMMTSEISSRAMATAYKKAKDILVKQTSHLADEVEKDKVIKKQLAGIIEEYILEVRELNHKYWELQAVADRMKVELKECSEIFKKQAEIEEMPEAKIHLWDYIEELDQLLTDYSNLTQK